MSKDLFLVIDMQNVYDKGGQWYCPNITNASLNIKKVLSQDLDVIFTKYIASTAPVGVWKQYNIENKEVNEDEFSNKIMDVFEEDIQKYPVYSKSTYSSCTIPEVLEKAKCAKRVVVSGVVAECCVLATVMALIDEGIKVIYLTDAVAGIDDQTESAVIKVLEGLAPLHIECMTTEEYLK